MILAVERPVFQQAGEMVTIDAVHVGVGDAITPGTRLFDCTVDLSSTHPHDCPPQTLYRVIARDTGWLRSLAIAPGQPLNGSAPLALLSTDPDEPIGAGGQRAVRLAIAAIQPSRLW